MGEETLAISGVSPSNSPSKKSRLVEIFQGLEFATAVCLSGDDVVSRFAGGYLTTPGGSILSLSKEGVSCLKVNRPLF